MRKVEKVENERAKEAGLDARRDKKKKKKKIVEAERVERGNNVTFEEAASIWVDGFFSCDQVGALASLKTYVTRN